MGRDLAMYGADVLNIWRPNATEVEAFAWDVQVGMRSTILDSSKEDRAKFDSLLKRCRRLLRQQAPRVIWSETVLPPKSCARRSPD